MNYFPLLIWYGGANFVTFFVYAFDKSAAKKGQWRISEKNLHLLALLGGWLGAFLAQKILRHKTQKQPFRAIFWLTVLFNCALLAGFFYNSQALTIFGV
jgi:uncharacterized membrane protein YsdA (DUF1294 family)